MICPLCGTRKARRACPALGKQICAVCCGTKRLVQIQCPSDCAWLATAREHPPAVVVRQQQRDLALLMQFMRDLGERQLQLLSLILRFVIRYEPPELQALLDSDVEEATSALASTYETASRGVIYEHRPASLPADRLVAALKPVVAEAGRGAGTPFERDAAVVLRRISEWVGSLRGQEPQNPRAFVELVGRMIRSEARGPEDGGPGSSEAGSGKKRLPSEGSRLIVP